MRFIQTFLGSAHDRIHANHFLWLIFQLPLTQAFSFPLSQVSVWNEHQMRTFLISFKMLRLLIWFRLWSCPHPVFPPPAPPPGPDEPSLLPSGASILSSSFFPCPHQVRACSATNATWASGSFASPQKPRVRQGSSASAGSGRQVTSSKHTNAARGVSGEGRIYGSVLLQPAS